MHYLIFDMSMCATAAK
jgi:hypothetical protein